MKMRHVPRDFGRLVRAGYRIARLNFSPSVSKRERHTLPGRLIISLTSYPPRFPALHKTLRSLLAQDIAPDDVVLWIAHDDRNAIPGRVEHMQDCGLTIHTCENFRSFNKIVHALAAYSDAFIATADDDMLYPADWLRRLVDGYRHPDEAVCQVAKRFSVGADGFPLPYTEWPSVRKGERASSLVQPIGSAGVLYPPRFFPERTRDARMFTRICPEADDLWLFWNFATAGKRARKVAPAKTMHTPGTQSCGLKHSNDHNGGNDRQIAALVDAIGMPVSPNHPVR